MTFDEELLEQLDQRPEVRERGRSRILREMTAAYLAEKRSEDIAREYREGYTKYPQTDEEIEWAEPRRGGTRGVVACRLATVRYGAASSRHPTNEPGWY